VNIKNNVLLLTLTLVSALSAMSAQAATSIKSVSQVFSEANPTLPMNVNADSWYNLTMGYLGWTHTSKWGFVKLQKGKPVTIEVTTDVVGLHPALSVWYRVDKKTTGEAAQYMSDHFYSQFKDIYESDAKDTDTPNGKKLGKFQMNFVANGFDRDGMADVLPVPYDQSMLNRLLDGVAGKVSVTFLPKESGVYQFVVGAINPDSGLPVGSMMGPQYDVNTTIKFPH
jgi:hypothetical protein